MSFRVRPTVLIDDNLLGRGGNAGSSTVPPAAAATFPAGTLVRVNPSTSQAENVATGSSNGLALAEEAAVSNAYVGAGVDYPRTKPSVRLRALQGKRIGITVLGTWNPAYIGQIHPVKLDPGGSGYAVVDPSDTTSTDVVTILEVYGEQVPAASLGVWRGTVSATDSNVYVEARVIDTACWIPS